ncbi:YqaE/Pmp3 family membrane protein [Brevibacillus laterosporus]|uniref:YqaE/Pmp3 family membrane protein n=1 Tax=Brevibacillus laterosporus TaxID=1465 RepID=UPI0018F89436|nr:YqaE/Pmp3 family membrane protein [Brevibacillus laterosporus]MBG9773572.1 hypothetical protein [Brevibacillus laterosporus]
MYLLAVLLPPIAVSKTKRWFSTLINMLFCFTLVLWPLAIIHAILVVADHKAKERKELLQAIRAISKR